MYFINFKSYKSGTGRDGEQIALLCEKYSCAKAVFIPVVQAVDIYHISQRVKINVWAQSADARLPHKNTGYVTPYSLKKAGAYGFFINHSDNRKTAEEIINLIILAKKHSLKTLLFADSPKQILAFDKLEADFLSLEDPNLIASNTAMVNKYEDQLTELSQKLKTVFIIGAGIRTKAHYQKSKLIGAAGVVLSSQIMESKEPEKEFKKLSFRH